MIYINELELSARGGANNYTDGREILLREMPDVWQPCKPGTIRQGGQDTDPLGMPGSQLPVLPGLYAS